MKAVWLVCLICLVRIGGVCQSPLLVELEKEGLISGRAVQQLADHTASLKKKSARNDHVFLYRLFWSTRHTFLKNYTDNTSLQVLFEGGDYDCLTATTLYALMLQEFGYQFRIVETNYHILLIATTSKGEVLLETTDPFNGFVESQNEIDRRLKYYQENLLATAAVSDNQYMFKQGIFFETHPRYLVNLLYFNQAVSSFNHQQWLQSGQLLLKAQENYSSPRIAELAALLVQTVLTLDSIKDAERQFILTHFRDEWLENKLLVSSR